MKFTTVLAFALPALTYAFPAMMGASSRADLEDALREQLKREAAAEPEPQITNVIGNLVGSLGDTVGGLLNSVGNALVVASNKRPEPGYTFKAPGPGDSRGPCPGLNLLANYGYLPRNGFVNFGQVLDATSRGFNMGTDLATVLATFAVLANGDIDTQSFYLGSGKNGVGGLNRHSTVEADVSPTREDYYNGCGDNHHLSSRLVKQLVKYVDQDPKKEFSMDAMGKQYAETAGFSKNNNPFLYYFPFPQIVSVGAFAFYPNFFSNGTYGAGGVANAKSILSIIGASFDKSTGEFTYVPERWPENWYRRATPYGAVNTLTDGFLKIYPRNIIVPGVAQFGTANLNAQTILCDFYQGINSITPLVIGGTEERVAKGISWALSVLVPAFGGTAAGCPDNVIAPNFLYPQSQTQGGPTTPPPVKADGNTGDNVYNKVYFKTAPTNPTCKT
ncbi:uncharacterized protein EKO05_0010367 [Ascochyta rabiei]|uniref:uncharacterized protein n=1 Tax=Didymella rabiei TaxID=5454 RepID=UPI0019015F21|nr:uncharacterized protein EKO05_0010367 [Ascochyta rabiei]UPX20123.1 hypothetical protein EKO05_0010367 [Ascochyta rabiei]